MIKFVFASILIFFTGCSDRNAFVDFNMTKEQEIGIDAQYNSKIIQDNNISGMISISHLNQIYPDRFYKNEVYLLGFYFKNNNTNILELIKQNLQLNGAGLSYIQKIDHKDKLLDFLYIKNSWNRYFIVKFIKQSDKSLNLIFKNNQATSNKIKN